jgi:hypothetical protein
MAPSSSWIGTLAIRSTPRTEGYSGETGWFLYGLGSFLHLRVLGGKWRLDRDESAP